MTKTLYQRYKYNGKFPFMMYNSNKVAQAMFNGTAAEELVEPSPEIDYSREYFFIDTLQPNTNIKFVMTTASSITYAKYSYDKTNWTNLTISSTTHTINIPNASRVYISCVAHVWNTGSRTYIYCDNNYNIGGNIASLLYGDNFIGQVTMEYNTALSGVFSLGGGDDASQRNQYLLDASNLVIPFTTLRQDGLSWMFANCNNLVHGPKDIPFNGVLPLGCCWRLFYRCSSLVETPIMRFTSMSGTQNFYEGFRYCTSLQKVTCLLTTYPSGYAALTNWLANVPSTGTFYKAPSMTGWPSGSSGIPTGWTVVDYTE